MAMAVLRSHDCLGGRFRDESLTLASFRSRRKIPSPIQARRPNPNPNDIQSGRRKRSLVGFRSPAKGGDRSRPRSGALVEKTPGKKLVMGEVKILKRGEALKSDRGVGVFAGESGNRKPRRAERREKDSDLVLGSTSLLGPDPATVTMQIKVSNRASSFAALAEGVYAGSGAFSCSPPPSSVPLPAFLQKYGAATNDLRRLLQLD